MQWFLNLNIGTKLLISNSILGLLIVGLSVLTIHRLEVIEGNVERSGEVLYAVDTLLQADRDLYEVLVAERSMIFARPSSAEFKALAQSHRDNIVEASDRVEQFMAYSHDIKIDDMYASYLVYRNQWLPLTEKIRSARESDTRAGRRTAIDLSFGSASESFEKMRAQINAMVQYTELYADDANEATVYSVSHTQKMIVTLMLISLGLAIGVAIIFPRLIVKPIRTMTGRVNELASGGGDLTQKLLISSHDEIGEMGNSVNGFIDSLRSLLSSIVALGQTFSSQAASLDESSLRNDRIAEGAMTETNMIASSVSEMTSSFQMVAENANSAAQQAMEANNESEQGKEVVSTTKVTIHKLSEEVQKSAAAIETLKSDTSKIEDVVNVIRGIAEQTNLLALNAAIEAARAGEQGRGFAVVADEVRALASRTQASTEEIQVMISTLQHSAEEAYQTMQLGKGAAEMAVEQADQAWNSLENINHSIAIMADMNSQIATASEQQSQVSSEINTNVNKLSLYSSEASDVATEVKNLAQDMSKMALDLEQRLSNFNL